MSSMVSYPTKMKDPRTCRIFFSSPFGGMEEEREELTRKYFPQIHHLCNSRGIQFVPVDMRWGITSEAAENAQTVNICLRELDRSDVFVGFFGQRYGWHGREDTAFQNNIDNAVGRYPWLENYRDRSVTEMEFLHGHLNNPGALPAVICFRDKSYDEQKHVEGEKSGNKKQVFKYTVESDHASALMDDLKVRVQQTKEKTLGVAMKYSTPEKVIASIYGLEVAKFIFDTVWEHLTKVLLVDLTDVQQSPRQKSLAFHDAFMSNRSSLYIGGQKYYSYLGKNVLDPDEVKPVAVCGPAGCGKSALLANWIKTLKSEDKGLIVAYHFIGCSPGSDTPADILSRMIYEVEFALDKEENMTEKYEDKNVRELITMLNKVLEKASSQTRNVLLVIDGLNKVKLGAKAETALYWLPKEYPRHIKLVVSVKDDHAVSVKALKEKTFMTMVIESLGQVERTEMCVKTLENSGKQLSPKQLDFVVPSEHSSNAMFLKIALSELSVFGYFRLLDKKIDTLMKCDGVGELFQEYLSRLEQDYNIQEYEGNLIKQVLSTLVVSHQGMKEAELIELLNIPQHVWSPLFFALEPYILDRSGVLGFAFTELEEAVKMRYFLTDDDRLSTTKLLIKYFDRKRMIFGSHIDLMSPEATRVVYELPWLHKDIQDWVGLAKTLSDLFVFERLVSESQYDLLELWKSTGVPFTEVASAYMKTVDKVVTNIYLREKDLGEMETPPGIKMLQTLHNMSVFLELSVCHQGREIVIKRMINILENVKGKNGLSEAKRQEKLSVARNQLGNLLVDTGKYDEGLKLHKENIKYIERCLETGDLGVPECNMKLGIACNGIGIMHLFKNELDEALENFEKSLSFHESGSPKDISSSMQNMANIYMKQNKLEQAIEMLEKSKKILEDIHFGRMHHSLGNILTNLGQCYRRLNKLEEAEAIYMKSLEMKAAAVGWDHPFIAYVYMNLGVVELQRNNFEKAHEHCLESLRISEKNEIAEDDPTYRQTLENYVNILQGLSKDEEAERVFVRVFDILSRNNALSQCLPSVFNKMAQFYINSKRYPEAEKVLVALMTNNNAQVLTYFCLDFLDSLQPPQIPRPEFMTLDYGLKLWPGDHTLGLRKAQAYLIPSGDMEGLLSLLSEMINDDYTTSMYEAGASWCEEQGNKDMAVEVLKAGLEKYPDHLAYETRLIDLLKGLRRYTEAESYVRHAITVVSDNPALFYVGGYILLMCGDTDAAIDTLTRVLEMGNEDLSARAQDLLNKIADFVAKNQTKSEDNKENTANETSGEDGKT